MSPFIVQWGIIGCGSISGSFVRDLVLPTSERDAKDVSHVIAAVGSRDVTKAEKFIKDNCPQGGDAQKTGLSDIKTSAKGSYKDCVEDPNVQAVYIGTPNTAHYDDCKLTLEAGKHCLLEKPATLNAAEWKSLSKLAKSKNLFLMEAVWTRFNPNLIAIQKAIHEDQIIGDVTSLHSNLSLNAIGRRPDSDRVLAAELAGGALLDLGPYPWTWSMMMLYHHPKNQKSPPQTVSSTMLKHKTGVDLDTLWGMTFPNLTAMAHCTASLMAPCVPESICRIIGTKGEISVLGHTSRPSGYIIRKFKDPSDENSPFLPDEKVENDFSAGGLGYEADAFARCLKDGLIECPRMPHSETLLMMETFDKIREQGGYKYPSGLERVT